MQQKITIIIESDDYIKWVIPAISEQLTPDESIIYYTVDILENEDSGIDSINPV